MHPSPAASRPPLTCLPSQWGGSGFSMGQPPPQQSPVDTPGVCTTGHSPAPGQLPSLPQARHPPWGPSSAPRPCYHRPSDKIWTHVFQIAPSRGGRKSGETSWRRQSFPGQMGRRWIQGQVAMQTFSCSPWNPAVPPQLAAALWPDAPSYSPPFSPS